MGVNRCRGGHRRNLPVVPLLKPQSLRRGSTHDDTEVGLALQSRGRAAGWGCAPYPPSVKDMTTITASTPPQAADPHADADRPPARGLLAQLGIDTAYVLIGFPLSIVAFVLVITGLSTGAGLLITLLGIPVLVVTLFAARGLAEVERLRILPVLRQPRLRVQYRQAPPDAGWWRRMFTPLGDIQAWLDVLHGVLRFPVSVAAFSVVITWWSAALGGLTYIFWDWALPHTQDNYELPELLGFADTPANRISFYLIMGVVFALTLPFVVRACALLEAYLGRALLTGVAELRDQVAGLTQDRATAQAQTAAAVSAEATALRRLERDIHDGPQQRLVRLAVDLGRAKQQLDADPDAARRTVDEAIAQTREALDELRTLSRGIAPPILTDRGLASAAAALAARATVPVTLDIPELERLPALAEQTAYFTIAEALVNIAKHSGASQAVVSVQRYGDRLSVTVTDNGRGGAHVAKGHGLAGLSDRLHAAGGELWVSSPPGGPTSIRAELPTGDIADDADTAAGGDA
jgi:signal transduction histidine kinase